MDSYGMAQFGQGIGSLLKYLLVKRPKQNYEERLKALQDANGGDPVDTVAAIQAMGPDSEMYKKFKKYTGLEPDPSRFQRTPEQERARAVRNFVHGANVPGQVTDPSSPYYINTQNPNFGAILDAARGYAGDISPHYAPDTVMQQRAADEQAAKRLEAIRNFIYSAGTTGVSTNANVMSNALRESGLLQDVPQTPFKYQDFSGLAGAPPQPQPSAPPPPPQGGGIQLNFNPMAQMPTGASGGGIELNPNLGPQSQAGGMPLSNDLNVIGSALASLSNYVASQSRPPAPVDDGFPVVPMTRAQTSSYNTVYNEAAKAKDRDEANQIKRDRVDVQNDVDKKGKLPLYEAQTKLAASRTIINEDKHKENVRKATDLANGIDNSRIGKTKEGKEYSAMIRSATSNLNNARTAIVNAETRGASEKMIEVLKADYDKAQSELDAAKIDYQKWRNSSAKPTGNNAPAAKATGQSTGQTKTETKSAPSGVSKQVKGM